MKKRFIKAGISIIDLQEMKELKFLEANDYEDCSMEAIIKIKDALNEYHCGEGDEKKENILLERSVYELNLSNKILNILEVEGLVQIRELVSYDLKKMNRFPNFSYGSILTLVKEMGRNHLYFGMLSNPAHTRAP